MTKLLTSIIKFILIILVLLIVLGLMLPAPSATTNSTTKEDQKSKTREKQLSHAFSAWSGAHKSLERMIINAMNDPDSYEHIETRYLDHGKTLFVITQYRGRNGFGGMVKSAVRARVDAIDGDVIEIVSQD
jgi:hypothetical protein